MMLPSDQDQLSKKRERRLAMNRNSARMRRQKKKELIHVLSNEVRELQKQQESMSKKNQALRTKTKQLENALCQAQETITSLMFLSSVAGGNAAPGTAPRGVSPTPATLFAADAVLSDATKGSTTTSVPTATTATVLDTPSPLLLKGATTTSRKLVDSSSPLAGAIAAEAAVLERLILQTQLEVVAAGGM